LEEAKELLEKEARPALWYALEKNPERSLISLAEYLRRFLQ
jgi:hypothetical protein